MSNVSCIVKGALKGMSYCVIRFNMIDLLCSNAALDHKQKVAAVSLPVVNV